MIDRLVKFISTQEGWFTAGPNSIPRRLNNPGDVEYARQMGAMPVQVGVHTFAKFDTPQQGFVGLYRQALADIARGWTLRQLIASWAPPTENDTGTYLSNAVNAVGVSADTVLWNVLGLP